MVAIKFELQKLLFALVNTPEKMGSSSPNPRVDAYVAITFVFILFSINWLVRLFLVVPVAKRILTTRKHKARKAQVVRFAQSTMEALFYASFTLLGASIVPTQTWVWPSSLWWIGHDTGTHHEMRDDLRCYYLMYGARYAQGFVSVLLEPKRKDFLEMQLHHVVTVAVVAVSYFYGWNRVGACVMLLLDPADVPLHIAKLCKHVGDTHQSTSPKRAKVFFLAADITFVIFAIFFFVTRVAMYPYLCWSAHIESSRYFPTRIPETICVMLLETLLALQVYWFFLIVKSAYNMIVNGHVDDVRSDDEADDDEHLD